MQRIASITFVLLLFGSAARAQEKVISARAGLVTGVESEVLHHCHEKGELRYVEKGKTARVKKGRKVYFRRAEKEIEHGTCMLTAYGRRGRKRAENYF